MNLLALSGVTLGILFVLFLVVSVMMILVVLVQRPQGGGLSEAFGANSGSGHTAFGAKTGDALTTATIAIFVLFLGTAVALNFAVRPAAPETTAQAQPAPDTVPADDATQPDAPREVVETDLNLDTDGEIERTPANDADQTDGTPNDGAADPEPATEQDGQG